VPLFSATSPRALIRFSANFAASERASERAFLSSVSRELAFADFRRQRQEQEFTQSLEKLQIFVDGRGQRAARSNRHADGRRNKRARDALPPGFIPNVRHSCDLFAAQFSPRIYRHVGGKCKPLIRYAPAGMRDIEYSGVKARDSGSH